MLMVRKNAMRHGGLIGAIVGGVLFMALPWIIGMLAEYIL